MIKESTEWKNHVEVNSSLMKRFDESRGELEKVLKVAQAFLNERGNPEDLLKKHTVRARACVMVRTIVLDCILSGQTRSDNDHRTWLWSTTDVDQASLDWGFSREAQGEEV